MAKFRINYTRVDGKRSVYDCSAHDAIEALTKLSKNRINYGDRLLDLNNINIRHRNPVK